jgi:O-antigen/teichoic acid export membrane protein
VVILGRTGRTEFNFPAAIGALVANVALNLVLVPAMGITGAGLALVASYLVVLGLMYVFTQRLFPVPYEWGRLLRVVLTVAALVGIAELAVPTSGAIGLLPRVVLFAAYPLVLFTTGFFTDGERVWLAKLRHPGAVIAGLASLRAQPAAVEGDVSEIYEAERMDEDARL